MADERAEVLMSNGFAALLLLLVAVSGVVGPRATSAEYW